MHKIPYEIHMLDNCALWTLLQKALITFEESTKACGHNLAQQMWTILPKNDN